MIKELRIYYDAHGGGTPPSGSDGTDDKKDESSETPVPPASQRHNVGLSIWTGAGRQENNSKVEYVSGDISVGLFKTLFVRVGEDVQHEDKGDTNSSNTSATGHK